MRRVRSITTGPVSAPRRIPATGPSSARGAFLTARPSGACSSRRAVPAGSFRCQPASGPPVRRRSVTRARSSRRSPVSW